jgi:hypothetical protein
MKFIKKFLNKAFQSSSRIKNLLNAYSAVKEPILLIGDGLSAIYSQEHFKNYKFIICCNLSILNKNLKKHSPLFWLLMEPNLWIQDVSINKILKETFLGYKNTIAVMHPMGRVFLSKEWKNLDAIYFSTYNQVKFSDGSLYTDFSSAFEISLGLALHCGFREIHFTGFDLKLLSPRNTLRWYSNSSNPDECDSDNYSHEIITPSLEAVFKNCSLSVYTYRHYLPRYFQISKIETIPFQDKLYIPSKHRANFIHPKYFKVLKNWESLYYPNGYERRVNY